MSLDETTLICCRYLLSHGLLSGVSGVGCLDSQGMTEPTTPASKRKFLAVAIAAVLIVSGTAFVWNQYFRYWTIEDIAAAVSGEVSAPDFKHSLANKTVTVKGTVTNITSDPTASGTLHRVELDDFDMLHLVYWDQVPFSVGERVKADVSFEWSCYNEEAHVYSPQLDFPVIFSVLPIATVLFACSTTCDLYWTVASEGDEISLAFDWVGEELPLGESNCSLQAGEHSFTQEYIDASRGWYYGTEIDRIDPISSGSGRSGLINYSDADGDGNLSAGDFITVKGLPRPDSESGVLCYMIRFGWDFPELADGAHLGLYLPLTKRGILVPDYSAGNYVRLSEQRIDNGFRMDVDYSLNNTIWPDTGIRLAYDFNCSDYDFPDPLVLTSLAEGTDFGVNATWISGPLTMGTISWTIKIRDANSDGILNIGDCISLLTDQPDSIASIEYLQIHLTYEPNDTELDYITLIAPA